MNGQLGFLQTRGLYRLVQGYRSSRYADPMVSLAEKIPVDEVIAARQASRAGPGRLLLTLVLGTFFITGWLAGRSWLMALDCANSVRIGWWRGKGLTADQVRERLTAAAAAAAAAAKAAPA